MTLYEFNFLEEAEKTAVLWADGVFISHRQEQENGVLLYQVYSFYVELYYRQDINEIQRLRSFSNTGPLEPYLHNIDISSLLR
ncbi:MAG: hypothetical protein JWQ09_2162 [Segetibacter sp.]|nr:hypothetical protein [Segetibacter sp.]